MKKQIIILALTLGASSVSITAQEGKPPAGGPPGGGQRQGSGEGRQRGEGRPEGQVGEGGRREGGPGQGGPGQAGGGPGGQRGMSPIIEALDLNKDGTIDAEELNQAAASLKKLDKNNDGKLTEAEYRPLRPGGQGGPGAGGQGGPGAGGGRPEGQGGPDGGQGARGQGRPPGGEPGAPGGEGRPQRPPFEQ